MASRSITITTPGSGNGPAGDGWRGSLKQLGKRAGAIGAAIGLIAATIALGFVLASYHVTDPALNTAAGGPAENVLGTPGAWIADLALSLFGPAVAIVLPLGLLWGLRLWRGHSIGRWRRSLGIALFAVLLLVEL